MARFRPRELREGIPLDELRRELNEAQKEIAAEIARLSNRGRVTELIIAGPFAARNGDIVRVAPPSGGLALLLPPVNLEQPEAVVTVLLESAKGGDLFVEAVGALVNDATTVTIPAAVGIAQFRGSAGGWVGFFATA